MSAGPPHVRELIARADSLRDSRQYRAAADSYRAALRVDPTRADVWVQLGNMTKDDGDFPAAVEAYAEALRRQPRNADTYLQLGRALKLHGRRDEAFEALARALDIAPGARDVIREVVDLGLGWRVERESGIGVTLALSVARALDELKSAIARIEGELPTIAALNAVPVAHYGEYRRRYRVPPAALPDLMPRLGLAVLGSAPHQAVLDCLEAIKAQRKASAGLLMPALQNEALAAARASLREVRVCPTQTDEPRAALASAIEGMPDVEWLVILREPVLLDPEAIGWILAEAHRTAAVAVFCDEDEVERDSRGQWLYRAPQLRGSLDPELLSQGHDLGTLLAVRREVLAPFVSSSAEPLDGASLWNALASMAARHGAVTHVSKVLVSRFAEMTPRHEQPGAQPARPGTVPLATVPELAIDVVIPTRNGGEHLEACLAALRSTAARSGKCQFTIIDNGSDDTRTLAWLERGRNDRRFAVLRQDEPFNWSRLNNLAVAATSAPLLLFLNDDVELLTHGWDDVVRELLSRQDVGAVGARLAYPDRTLQHAGMVVGGAYVTDHEGRGDPLDAPGPMGRWQTRRSVSAVTGAFLSCRRDVFSAMGGFDAGHLPIWFSDVDFCLKVGKAGLRVLYEPRLLAIHHESKTIHTTLDATRRQAVFADAAAVMRARWGDRVTDDPWYNPQYSRLTKPYQHLAAPRATS